MSVSLTAFFKAVEAGSKVYHLWLKGKEQRHAKAAQNAAENYIFTNESDSLTDAVKAKRLKSYRKRFFKYN